MDSVVVDPEVLSMLADSMRATAIIVYAIGLCLAVLAVWAFVIMSRQEEDDDQIAMFLLGLALSLIVVLLLSSYADDLISPEYAAYKRLRNAQIQVTEGETTRSVRDIYKAP